MADDGFNADFGKLAIVHTAAVPWQASPSPTVWRKRLDLAGPSETSRVTSLVRYDPDSAFPTHPHPDGEEILVIEGVFSDEHGDYPAGHYLLNPEGFEHAPFSRQGCVIFVKLRQYLGAGRRRIAVDTGAGEWRAGSAPGIARMPLYGEAGYPETMSLVRFDPGARVPAHDHPAGEEILVIEGGIEDETGRCEAGSWARHPPGSSHAVYSENGCVLYVKTGHLGF